MKKLIYLLPFCLFAQAPPTPLPNGWVGGNTLPATCASGISPTFYSYVTQKAYDCTNNTYTLRGTDSLPGTANVVAGVSTIRPFVTLTPASDIQAAINLNPTGTVFSFGPGLYRGVSFQPKDNDTFLGNGWAKLNGAVVLSGASFSGGLYQYSGQTAVGQTGGQCDSTHPFCIYPQDLFFNESPLTRVGSTGAVVPGTWFWDLTAHIIYMLPLGSVNPSTGVVQLGVTPWAIQGVATGVMVDGFIIEKYASATGQFGAVGNQIGTNGWIIQNNEIRQNHSNAINVGSNTVAQFNYAHDNGDKGIGCLGDSMLIQGNTLNNNNYAGFDPMWESGGMKCSVATNVKVLGNVASGNIGPGIWFDQQSQNMTVNNNYTANNVQGAGIQFEISKTGTCSGNTSYGNYVTPIGSFGFGAQIQIQNSQNIECFQNYVANDATQGGYLITVLQQDRTTNNCAWGTTCPAMNNYVHDNRMILNKVGQTGVGANCDFNCAQLVNQNNVFRHNDYHSTDLTVTSYVWPTSGGGVFTNYAGFQTASGENGTFDNVIPTFPTIPTIMRTSSTPMWGSGVKAVGANSLGFSTNVSTWSSTGLSDSGVSLTSGTGAPSGNCVIGSIYINLSGGTSTTLYVCTAANTWTAK